MKLKVLVQPRASRNAVLGWQEDALRVALCAPPVDGEANAALTGFLAESLGLKRAQVSLVAGQTSRRKTVEIPNMTEAQLRQALGQG